MNELLPSNRDAFQIGTNFILQVKADRGETGAEDQTFEEMQKKSKQMLNRGK